MPHYTAEKSLLGDQPIVVLTDADGRRTLRVACHGAALLSFEVPVGDALHDIADGYRDANEVAGRPGSRFAIMAPFAGRIGDARYSFDGQPQDLQPGVTGPDRAARHGFVRNTDFAIAELAADEAGARVTLTTKAIRPQPGYPHAIDLAVTFSLNAKGLALDVGMRNVGDSDAPCFFGWHPYFRVGNNALGGATADGWQLQIPAQTLIRTDADLIALPGAAAYVPLDDAPAFDFRQARTIGSTILDHEYTDLQAEADGIIRTRLRDPATGLAIAVWQERGVMHAFTADTAARDARRAVALEPMECMADAFNRSESQDAIRLAPGAERHFRCGVDVLLP
jgi:aldose 1-epimerase